jgi:hypothetical protein
MTTSSTLTALQTSAVNLLNADDFFKGLASVNKAAIPIVSEIKGDIVSEIQKCLGQVGIVAVILTPMFEFHDYLLDDLNGWAHLSVDIFEDAVVNQGTVGTKVLGIVLAERIVAILHGAPHGVLTGPVGGNPASNCFLGIQYPIKMISEGPPLHYNVSFQAHVQLNPTYS